MKAERRHDLKTNSLASALADFPTFMRLYGSRVVLGVLILALAGLLIYNYTTGKTTQDTQSREALASAHLSIGPAREELGSLGPLSEQRQMRGLGALTPQQLTFGVEDITKNIKEGQTILANAVNATDPSVRADAEVLRGDASLQLASLPPLPGSTTRPSLNGDRSKDELLKSAEDSYNQVIRPPLNANATAVRNARFGLAAIAENRKEWDRAKQLYQEIIDDSSTPTLFKDQARGHQDELAEMQRPLLSGTPRPVGPLGSLADFGFPPLSQSATMPSAVPGFTVPLSTQPTATQPTSTQP